MPEAIDDGVRDKRTSVIPIQESVPAIDQHRVVGTQTEQSVVCTSKCSSIQQLPSLSLGASTADIRPTLGKY